MIKNKYLGAKNTLEIRKINIKRPKKGIQPLKLVMEGAKLSRTRKKDIEVKILYSVSPWQWGKV